MTRKASFGAIGTACAIGTGDWSAVVCVRAQHTSLIFPALFYIRRLNETVTAVAGVLQRCWACRDGFEGG